MKCFVVIKERNYPVIKAKDARLFKRSDGLWRFACGDIFTKMQTPKCQTLHCWKVIGLAVLSGKLKAKPIILKSHKLSEFRSHSGIDFCSHPCTVFYFQCIVRVL